MAKAKVAFVCNECGADYSKWQGQCNACGAWNSLSEFKVSNSKTSARVAVSQDSKYTGYSGAKTGLQNLSDIDLADVPRFSSGAGEFDRVLGGGLVPGGVVLIGGSPGAGKSTLLLQTMCLLAQQQSALYVTGEESLQQVAMRAQRLGLPTQNLKMLSETNIERILDVAQENKPKIVVIDSIQVMHLDGVESAPGSVSQVRESAAVLTRFAKQTQTAILLVGHVTKDGTLAGPKVLEHMVDCSVLLEGSEDSRFRTLRGMKNRFGAVNELGVFAMLENGLKEVKNPSSIFLNRNKHPAAGSLVMVVWEGTRPLLVELQALVDDSAFSNPKRVTVGFDQNRLAMLLAVLHKHGGLLTSDQDVYLNVVGGVKVLETSGDLAAISAVVSSFRDRVLSDKLVVLGEVGLSGEIRPVPSGQERISEAAKHGFTKAVVPKGNVPKKPIEGMTVVGVDRLSQALDAIFEN